MPVHLLKDAPILEAAVEGFVVRPGRRLHPQILGGVAVVVRAFHLVRAANVAIVGLDALARLEEVREDVVKDLDVCPLAGRVESRPHTKFPARMSIPSLYWSADLPPYLWEPKRFPFFATLFCWIR
jgi:hypothetical protein